MIFFIQWLQPKCYNKIVVAKNGEEHFLLGKMSVMIIYDCKYRLNVNYFSIVYQYRVLAISKQGYSTSVHR
jgi:hypothetical protein